MLKYLGIAAGVVIVASYFLPWAYVPGVIGGSSGPKALAFGWSVLVLGACIIARHLIAPKGEPSNLTVAIVRALSVAPFLLLGFVTWRAAAIWFRVDIRPAVEIFLTGIATPRVEYGFILAIAGALAAVISNADEAVRIPRVLIIGAVVVISVTGVTFAYSRLV